ncbi:hypothetical protein LguiA_034288 [Lonicera macranthoides]
MYYSDDQFQRPFFFPTNPPATTCIISGDFLSLSSSFYPYPYSYPFFLSPYLTTVPLWTKSELNISNPKVWKKQER